MLTISSKQTNLKQLWLAVNLCLVFCLPAVADDSFTIDGKPVERGDKASASGAKTNSGQSGAVSVNSVTNQAPEAPAGKQAASQVAPPSSKATSAAKAAGKPANAKQVLLNNQTLKQQTLNKEAPAKPSSVRLKFGTLQGGVSMDAPHTSEQVTKYLQTMRGIIHDYEEIAVSSLLSADGGVRMDADSIGAVQNHTLSMIEHIRSTVPPYELKNKHNELASTLAYVSPYIENPFQAGSGIEALSQLAPVLSRLHDTLERYHSGVRNCMAFYNLDPKLDPFYGESEDAKQRLNAALNQTKSNLLNPPSGNGESTGGDAGSIGNLLNSLGAGGGSLDALQGMLGGGSGGSLGNGDASKGSQGMDLNGLIKQLSKSGGLPGGLSGGGSGMPPLPNDTNGLDNILPGRQSGGEPATPSPNNGASGDVNQIFEQLRNQ